MDRLIVNVVLQKVLVHTGQEGHLRQGEDVHELFHGVSVGTLQAGRKTSETEANTTAELDSTFTQKDSGWQHLDCSPQEKGKSSNKVNMFTLFVATHSRADISLCA